jgi:hypothetical protein
MSDDQYRFCKKFAHFSLSGCLWRDTPKDHICICAIIDRSKADEAKAIRAKSVVSLNMVRFIVRSPFREVVGLAHGGLTPGRAIILLAFLKLR